MKFLFVLLFISTSIVSMNRSEYANPEFQSTVASTATNELKKFIDNPCYSPLWSRYGYQHVPSSYLKIIDKLLAQGARADIISCSGDSLLFVVVRLGSYYEGFDNTALQIKIIRDLLEKGVDINIANSEGTTVLEHATLHKQPAIATLLLEYRNKNNS